MNALPDQPDLLHTMVHAQRGPRLAVQDAHPVTGRRVVQQRGHDHPRRGRSGRETGQIKADERWKARTGRHHNPYAAWRSHRQVVALK
ncbi:hypothetical protein D3C71_1832680 [compost metagenome]